MSKRFYFSKNLLLFWCYFIGLGAVAGSIGMLVAIDGSAMGMQSLLPYFQVLPFADTLFQNFIFPGISLLIVNGLTNLTAATLIILKKRIGYILGFVFGITLMLWITIQFIIFPKNLLSTLYFGFGFLQFVTGYACYVFYCQDTFKFSESDYKNIGTNKKVLVVFFSRLGYTKKIAYQVADECGAEIIELKTNEPTEHTGGFWWCGRFAMHHWGMKLLSYNADLSNREKVIIVTPIWAFSLCAPIRSFCLENKGKISKVEYVFNHFNRASYKSVVKEMNNLLFDTDSSNLKDIAKLKASYCTRRGKIKSTKFF